MLNYQGFMVNKKVVLLVGLMLVVGLVSAQDKTWKLGKNKKGIRVYVKKVTGSKLNDSKTETTIKTTIPEIINEFKDVPNHHKWMDRVGESKLLKQVSKTEFYVYYHVNSPWPVSDRDLVAHYTIKQIGPGRVYLNVDGAPDFVPEKEKAVRIRDMKSSWFLSDKGEGKIDVVYHNHADPGGGIPDWLVNTASEDSPFNTVLALKEILEGKE